MSNFFEDKESSFISEAHFINFCNLAGVDKDSLLKHLQENECANKNCCCLKHRGKFICYEKYICRLSPEQQEFFSSFALDDYSK